LEVSGKVGRMREMFKTLAIVVIGLLAVACVDARVGTAQASSPFISQRDIQSLEVGASGTGTLAVLKRKSLFLVEFPRRPVVLNSAKQIVAVGPRHAEVRTYCRHQLRCWSFLGARPYEVDPTAFRPPLTGSLITPELEHAEYGFRPVPLSAARLAHTAQAAFTTSPKWALGLLIIVALVVMAACKGVAQAFRVAPRVGDVLLLSLFATAVYIAWTWDDLDSIPILVGMILGSFPAWDAVAS
jgi:hypothetical protein